MEDQKVVSTGCCEPFNPALWQEKEITWQDKLFVKDHVIGFLHMPLNFGQVMTKNMAAIEQAGAKTSQPLVMSEENSLWGSDIFIDVTKAVPNLQLTTLSGKYLSRVFEGSYKDMYKWVAAMKKYLTDKSLPVGKFYFYYPTCPKCAKAYGKNYVVIIAQIL